MIYITSYFSYKQQQGATVFVSAEIARELFVAYTVAYSLQNFGTNKVLYVQAALLAKTWTLRTGGKSRDSP